MEPKHFDPEALYSLLGDNKATIAKMLEKILPEAARKHEALNANVKLEDWVIVKGDAHFLKSNFKYLGAKETSALLKEMEHNAMEDGDKTLIPAQLERFNTVYPIIIKEVEEYLEYLKSIS